MEKFASTISSMLHVEGIFEVGVVEYLNQRVHQQPYHFVIAMSLILVMLYILVVKKAYDPSKRGYGARPVSDLTEREKEELIAEWSPEPLVSLPTVGKNPAEVANPSRYTIKDFVPGTRNVVVHIEEEPAEKVVFTSMDFLGLGTSEAVQKAAHDTLEEYSLGSCGPRGFYGTTLKHLELEKEIADFLHTPESITYSDAVATVASAIPAFAKRGDVLLMDAGINHAVQTGAKLSRSKMVLFKHNDMDDLKRHLDAFRAADKRRKEVVTQRRFIVVEGLYANYGDVCKLDKVIELANEYKWRIILDDSLGFGVLGKTGKGTIELFGRETLDVDIVTASLATTLASVGGFCVGSREVVDHQRLSGAGYCFSASAPPFLCATATASLRSMTANKELLTQLRARCQKVHEQLSKAIADMKVVSESVSPVFHLQLRDAAGIAPEQLLPKEAGVSAPFDAVAFPQATLKELAAGRDHDERLLVSIIDEARKQGILLGMSRYMMTEFYAPRLTLRFCLTLAHTDEHINKLLDVLPKVVRSCLHKK